MVRSRTRIKLYNNKVKYIWFDEWVVNPAWMVFRVYKSRVLNIYRDE